MRKPFYRSRLKCWYFKDEAGKFVRLDPDEEKAYKLWNAYRETRTLGPAPSYLALVGQWLLEHKPPVKKQATFDRAAKLIASFCNHIGTKPAKDLRPIDVLQWLQKPRPKPQSAKDRKAKKPIHYRVWSQHTQSHAATIIHSVTKWAVSEGHLRVDPLRKLSVPPGKPREVLVPQDLHKAMVHKVRKHKYGKQFALLLIASHCGARPQQVRTVTAANVLPDARAWIFADHKTRRHTNKPLIVYLPPCLQTLTRILVHRRPIGPLFLDGEGTPWTKDQVCRRMARLRKSLKIPEKVVLYSYRHTYATDSLLAGNSLADVAHLLGHTDTRMVSTVYGHLDQHTAHLQQAAARTAKRRLG